jgi:3-deoxy-D-manno-octulosonate 8-phosphate phosphatase (KDO 8-P phosphatase)
MTSYKELLPKITTLMLDVDGVLTDGLVYFMEKEIVRALNSKDGYAMQYATRKGIKIFIVTGGSSERIKESLEWLGVTEVHLKSADKLKVYEDIKARHNLSDEEIAYVGDDIPDIPVLKRVGVSVCPQDAAVEVKQCVKYQSPIDGGKGCVRELIEQIMRVQGTWYNEDAFVW